MTGIHAESMQAEPGYLAEIVVTARKRDESLQTVPISVSVRSGGEMEQRGEARLQDILRSMPNLGTDIQQPRLASIAIRGLGRNPANDGLESSVGVFVDGVYFGRIGMAITDLVDLERIEVLRGPQGTLFGKNATAGALSITTRSPSAIRDSWFELGAGDSGLREFRGAISAPLGSGELAYRLSAFATRRDGHIMATQRGERLAELDRYGGRAQLLWKPTADIRLRLIADYSSLDETGPGYLLVDPALYLEDGTVRSGNLIERAARVGYTPRFDPLSRQTDADAPQRMQSRQGGVSLQADWLLAGHSLTSITAGRRWNFHPQSDGDATAMQVQPVLGSDARYWSASQELRVASPPGAVEYLFGTYVFLQELRSSALTMFGPDAAPYFQAGLPSHALDGFGVDTSADPRTRSYATFGQVTWEPARTLEFTAGLRWTGEYRKARISREPVGGAALSPEETAAQNARDRLSMPADADIDTSEGFLSGGISIAWKPTPDNMIYAAVSRGAKSGGINVAIVPAGISQRIEPEVALNHELGMRTRWPRARLWVSLTGFATFVDDYQATVREPVRGAMFLANAGTVRSRGFELEAGWQPLAGLRLAMGAGWNDAMFTAFRAAPCPPEHADRVSCDFTGQRVAGAPPWNASLSADFEKPLGRGRLVAFAGGDYARSARYRSAQSRYSAIDSHGVLNARLGIRGSRGDWQVNLWAQNLLDTDYYTALFAGGSFNPGATFGLLALPRSCGITLRMQL